MSMVVVRDNISTVPCDCGPDELPKCVGHIKDGVRHSFTADDTVKIEQPDDELPAVKCMREIGYWSPPKYPWPRSPKKRKKNTNTKKKKQQPKKRKTDIHAMKEISPAVNEQGEHSEVQVFEEFNPDEILANLYNPPPPPCCPCCDVPMCLWVHQGS